MSTTTGPATSQTAPAATELAIRTERLTKRYSTRAAVDGVSLEVPTGVTRHVHLFCNSC